MNPYPSYKESGVEWIGKIPSEWETKRISHFFIERKETVDDRSYKPLSVTMGGIKDQLEGIAKTDNNDNRKKVCKGDFVINSRSDRKGSSGVSFRDGSVSVINTVLEPISIHPQYVHHLLRNYYFIEEFFRNGKGIHFDLWSTKYTTMKNIEIPVLSLQEQQQISNYLDHKTQQIDSLIEKTQQKIELLKEQRISLINQVVTKGLNPDVEMKDSGVEWIGEIPSGWVVQKLKYTSSILPSNVDKHIYPEEVQVRLCNYTDVYYNEFITPSLELKKGSCNQNEFDKFKLRQGDVIITKDSESPDDIGIPTLVTKDFNDVVCGYHLTLIRPRDVVGGYLFRFIQSDRTRKYFEINSDGVTRFGLGKPTIENMVIPLPPFHEQQQIVEYLDEQTKKIDSLIEKETKRLDLLKEYRQSLISDVVTGKVDVRDEVVV